MTFNFASKKCTAREETKAYTEKKIKKLEKFFTGDCAVHVVYTLEKANFYKVEITADYNGLIFRGQATSNTDFKPCVDEIADILIRQIRKHKTKLQKRLKESSFSFEEENSLPEDNEEDYKIIRNKTLKIKPMTDDEAVLQMDLLGHDFFIYTGESGNVKVLYKRKDGNLGIIETE